MDKNIALNLKRIRKSKNMSLDMLAERTGVSKSMLGQIERGKTNPTVSTIGKIVEGLKVPFEQLIYDRKEIMVMPSPEERALHSRNRDIHSHYARNFLSAFSRIRHSPCSSKYRSFCSSAAYSPANSIA